MIIRKINYKFNTIMRRCLPLRNNIRLARCLVKVDSDLCQCVCVHSMLSCFNLKFYPAAINSDNFRTKKLTKQK